MYNIGTGKKEKRKKNTYKDTNSLFIEATILTKFERKLNNNRGIIKGKIKFTIH